MQRLSERQQVVLGMVVREFIASAQPVGSQHIVDTYQLKWSPATVRNELSALEELGYLTHPHTSAGRIPTELGYRYFVEYLLERTELPRSEQIRIRHQFGQARQDLDQWLWLATSVVSQQARAAALATQPRAEKSRVKRIELVPLREGLALLLLVLHEGRVREQMVSLDPAMTAESIADIETQLNNACVNADADTIRTRATALSDVARRLAEQMADTLQEVDTGISDRVVREGLSHVLDAPELGGDRLVARQMMRLLEERPLLEKVLVQGPVLGEVRVIIGGDGRWAALEQMSLILSRYGISEGPTGVLGVIGPLRLPYGRAISTLRYVGNLMSELLADWYGRA